MSGRLALFRWVLRVVRAERRQHALVIAMVAFGIAIATLLISSTMRFREPETRLFANSEAYGNVSGFGDDPLTYAELETGVRTVLVDNPDIEAQISGPNAGDGLQLSGASPEAPLGAVNFSLLSGRWPETGEVAITGRGIEVLEAALGEAVEIGQTRSVGGADRTIVGIWENPTDLDSRIALVTPADVGVWEDVTLLLPTEFHPASDQIRALSREGTNGGISAYVQDRSLMWTDSSGPMFAYLGGTIVAFQVAILASAGFTVLAQRRTRQLGMLSAMGATPQRLGSVMQFTGLVCGVIAGIIGLGAGVLLSIVATPVLQIAVNHRLAAFDLPWAYLLPMIPLAVLTAIAAAWWPARRIRRTSTIDAIAARRPPETKVAPTVVLGFALLAAGGFMLVNGAPKNSVELVVGGASALVIGALLVIPGLVSVLGALAGRAPLPVRIAWRDINRNRARSSAAVAAAAIALAIPFGLASFVASLGDAWVPYRPTNVVSLYGDGGDSFSPADGPATFAPLLEIASDARLVPIETPVDRAMTEAFLEPGQSGDSAQYVAPYSVNMVRTTGEQQTNTAFATPALLEAMGIDEPDEGTDLVVFFESDLALPDASTVVERRRPVAEVFPQVVVFGDIDGISRDDVIVSEWLLVQDDPFTIAELDAFEAFTRSHDGFGVGLPDGPPPFLTIRAVALTVAMLLGISVVAVSVALIRVENENDSRALNAVGASPRTSRWIGAATAAGMVIVAVVVAVPASFLALSSVYLNPDENFDFTIPWLELGVVGVLLPLVAAAGGWLLTTTKVQRVSV